MEEVNELKVGTLVTARSYMYNEQGRITEMRPSSGARKGMMYRVNEKFFFADELIPIKEFTESPQNYYNMIQEMEEDLVKAIRLYGKTARNGTDIYYDYSKKYHPYVIVGEDKLEVKRIEYKCLEFFITTVDGKRYNVTYLYNVLLFCYWNIFDKFHNI